MPVGVEVFIDAYGIAVGPFGREDRGRRVISSPRKSPLVSEIVFENLSFVGSEEAVVHGRASRDALGGAGQDGQGLREAPQGTEAPVSPTRGCKRMPKSNLER